MPELLWCLHQEMTQTPITLINTTMVIWSAGHTDLGVAFGVNGAELRIVTQVKPQGWQLLGSRFKVLVQVFT